MAPNETPKNKPVSPGRGLRIALFVSLALNLAVVGTVAGMFLSVGPHGPRAASNDRGINFGRYNNALSPEDRAALRAAYLDLSAGRPASEARSLRAAHRAEQVALLASLRAEPFDLAAVAEVFKREQGRMTQGIEIGQALLLGRIEAMSPSERTAFADRLENPPARPRGRDPGANGRRDPQN